MTAADDAVADEAQRIISERALRRAHIKTHDDLIDHLRRLAGRGRRGPDDMSPAWMADPNAPARPSSDPESQREHESFEDEAGR